MAFIQCISSPVPYITNPTEIHDQILSCLNDILDKQVLRLTYRYFYNRISSPTQGMRTSTTTRYTCSYRYGRGNRWEELGVPFVRCLKSSRVAEAPQDPTVQMCLSCYTPILARKRALENQERVWREVAEQKERLGLRAERRQAWIDNGNALSEYSEDESEHDHYADPNYWGDDDCYSFLYNS